MTYANTLHSNRNRYAMAIVALVVALVATLALVLATASGSSGSDTDNTPAKEICVPLGNMQRAC